MTWLKEFTTRLAAMFRGRKLERELDDELRVHFELLIEENVRLGMSHEEARFAALRSFGGVEQTKETYRDQRGIPVLETLLLDLRYGFRMLMKSPGYTAIAVITLALGIGANAAIFTLTYAVILKSLPVPNPGQLVRYTFRNGPQDIGLSGPIYDSLRKHEITVSDLLAWSDTDFAVELNGAPKRVQGAMVSGNGFRVLELHPVLGRLFGDAADVSGGGPNGYQALISYAFWKDQFQGKADVLGKALNINGRSATIIGVLPQGFEGLLAGRRAEIVLPLAFEEIINAPHPHRHLAGGFWLTVMGRLKAGETVRSAEANLRATEKDIRQEADPQHIYLSGFFASFHLDVESGRAGRSYLRIIYSQPLLVLEMLVGLLLLLCCANTALLVLARLSSRQREFAVRSALGAPRSRLFRQVFVEVGLLAACGLAAGIYLGWVSAQTIVAMLPAVDGQLSVDVTPRALILGFTAAISVLSALGAGLWPAWRASRVAPSVDMKQGAVISQSKRMGRWFVPAQVAASVTLLSAAVLLASTFMHLLTVASGFQSEGLVVADVDLDSLKMNDLKTTQIAQQLLDSIESTPGVKSAAAMSLLPLEDSWSAGHYYSVGQNGEVHYDLQTWGETISPGYFRTMGTHIIEGSEPAKADVGGDQVCVLSQSAAGYFYPGANPVGQFIYYGGADPSTDGKTKASPENTCRIIGVAENAHFRSLREAPPRILYRLAGKEDFGSQFALAVRGPNTTVDAAAIRAAFRQVVPAAAAPTAKTFDQLVEAHLRSERMLMALSLCFAFIGLLLTGLGLYGMLARGVALRIKEIGLRLALGARPRDAFLRVIGEGLRLVVIGLAIGIAMALAVARLYRSLLFGVQAADPLPLIVVALVLLGVALIASGIPAWRATKVNPMEALRYE
jgi:putative ABC transport system permease protein